MIEDDIEHDSPDEIDDAEPTQTEFVKNEPSPLIPRKTKAQIWEDTVIPFIQFL